MNIYERHGLARQLQHYLSNVQWPVNAQEPDYVAILVDVLPGFIVSSLNALLPGHQISAGGAFIHQKPLVHFTQKSGYRDPELGDLLIVCREKRFSGYCYNAILLQAKRTATPFNEMIPNDHQYILYSEWPEFEYKRADYLNGKTRSVLPKTITQGAQYLLIDESQSIDLFTATVDRPLSSSKLFARTLAAILSFDAGRTFQANSPRDDWSQMILDLLRLSATSVFNRRRSGYIGAKRWNGNSAFEYILNQEEEDRKMDDYTPFLGVETNETHSGIGVICVDLGDNIQSID